MTTYSSWNIYCSPWDSSCFSMVQLVGIFFLLERWRFRELFRSLSFIYNDNIFFLFAAQTFCNGVPIYSREEWGARPANCETFMPTPVTYIFIHHTVTAECSDFNSCAASARAVQDFHMDGNGNKILYTVLFTRTFCKQRTNVRKGKEIWFWLWFWQEKGVLSLAQSCQQLPVLNWGVLL